MQQWSEALERDDLPDEPESIQSILKRLEAQCSELSREVGLTWAPAPDGSSPHERQAALEDIGERLRRSVEWLQQ